VRGPQVKTRTLKLLKNPPLDTAVRADKKVTRGESHLCMEARSKRGTPRTALLVIDRSAKIGGH
jgi:hypothetical protein